MTDAREAWLARRREILADGMCRVQASDVPAILAYYDPALAADVPDGAGAWHRVFAEKLEAPGDDTAAQWWGREDEDPIARRYSIETGRPVRDLGAFEIQQHPDIPWLGATLDRVTRGPGQPHAIMSSEGADRPVPFSAMPEVPLQIKSAIGSRHRWADGPPDAFDVQVQVEVACCCSAWGALAVRTGNAPLHTYDLERVALLNLGVLTALEDFRRRVRDRDPLPAKAPAALVAAKSLFGTAGNGETILADEKLQQLVEGWQAARYRAGEAEKEAAQIEADLRFLVGDATWARLPGGALLERKLRRVRAHERKETQSVVLTLKGGRR